MKITADTNVLLRVALRDDERQARVAEEMLNGAELVAISTQTLCELVWVLTQGYKHPPEKVASAIRVLINGESVAVDRREVAAGLAMLDAGGDFADGVIPEEGAALGAETFVSFDKKAVKLLADLGVDAKLLG